MLASFLLLFFAEYVYMMQKMLNVPGSYPNALIFEHDLGDTKIHFSLLLSPPSWSIISIAGASLTVMTTLPSFSQ